MLTRSILLVALLGACSAPASELHSVHHAAGQDPVLTVVIIDRVNVPEQVIAEACLQRALAITRSDLKSGFGSIVAADPAGLQIKVTWEVMEDADGRTNWGLFISGLDRAAVADFVAAVQRVKLGA